MNYLEIKWIINEKCLVLLLFKLILSKNLVYKFLFRKSVKFMFLVSVREVVGGKIYFRVVEKLVNLESNLVKIYIKFFI